jgi:multicomponent Na+:H+ antiporter subunit F
VPATCCNELSPLDLLAVLVIALLAVPYARDVGFYLDSAVAVSLLSFVATVAAGRYISGRRAVQ